MTLPTSETDRKEKWQAAFKRFSGWDTPQQRKVQQQEAQVMTKWLLNLNLPHYDILEIGCGNGHFGKMVVEKLVEANVSYKYNFTDFLPECIEKTKTLMQTFPQSESLTFTLLDVYKIDSVFPPQSQQIILSTGFVSPVTYKDAIPKVSNILKTDGILICDFINHFSPLLLFAQPLNSIKKLLQILRPQNENVDQNLAYHFGLIGTRKFFQAHKLNLVKHRTIRLRRNPLLCMFRKQ